MRRFLDDSAATGLAASIGWEDVIPGMFSQLLGLWERGDAELPHSAYYLRRHIELDGEQHGPLAKRMLVALASTADCWAAAARLLQCLRRAPRCPSTEIDPAHEICGVTHVRSLDAPVIQLSLKHGLDELNDYPAALFMWHRNRKPPTRARRADYLRVVAQVHGFRGVVPPSAP